MATYSLIADVRGHAWYHSWLLKTGSWDDAGWWADVAAWEPNEGINFGIGEAAGTGSFTLSGQDAGKQIVNGFGAGSFTVLGQDAFKSLSEAAGAGVFTLNGQAITEAISVAHGAGIFSLAGQDAFRGVTEVAGTGIFVFNGVPITKAYSERIDEGLFVVTGQNVPKGILELAGGGIYLSAGQSAAKIVGMAASDGGFGWSFSWLLKTGSWDDAGWWADVMAWEATRDINFGITDVAGAGVFVLAGQGIIKRIKEFGDVGLFTLTMQDALVWRPRYEFQNQKPAAVLFASGPNSAMLLSAKNEAA